eukprot:5261810-Pleurochrysis_carterae.AAC.1
MYKDPDCELPIDLKSFGPHKLRQFLDCVLLRALHAHNTQPPPPGPASKEKAIRLLLPAVKKRRLPGSLSDEAGLAEDDGANGAIDLENNTDDTASEISLTSARARNKQQRRLSGRGGKGYRGGVRRGGRGRGRSGVADDDAD